MAIIKNDIPILEYDNNQNSVLMPNHENLKIVLPEKAVFAFLGDTVEKYAKLHCGKKVTEFVSITKTYPVYVVPYQDEKICLCQAPVGAAAAVQILDWLIGYGVKKIISAGSCGAIDQLPENCFLVPTRALRDEGTSYHYLPPSRFVNLNEKAVTSIKKTLDRLNLPYKECTTWTTDGFFRETKEKIEYRKSEGCSVVEMECAALAACAEFRGVQFGQLIYTADSLANVDSYDERNWGAASLKKAMQLCMKIISDM